MNTKFNLLILLFLVVANKINAQDILMLKNGDEQKVKVLEVNTNDVKYKKWDNQNGPAYTVLKSELFMVKYENGSKDVFKDAVAPTPPPVQNNNNGYNNGNTDNNNSRKQVDQELNKYKAQQEYDKNNRIFKKRLGSGIACTAIGVPFLFGGIGMVVGGWNLENSYGGYGDADEAGIPLMIVGAAMVLAGIPLTIVGPIKIATAMKYRRKANAAKASMSFEPMLRPMHNGADNRALGIAAGMGFKIKF